MNQWEPQGFLGVRQSSQNPCLATCSWRIRNKLLKIFTHSFLEISSMLGCCKWRLRGSRCSSCVSFLSVNVDLLHFWISTRVQQKSLFEIRQRTLGIKLPRRGSMITIAGQRGKPPTRRSQQCADGGVHSHGGNHHSWMVYFMKKNPKKWSDFAFGLMHGWKCEERWVFGSIWPHSAIPWVLLVLFHEVQTFLDVLAL